MQLPVTIINSKSKIALRRILPIEGEILVTSGQAVTASTPVARAELPAKRQVVDVAWQLGRLHVDMDEVLQVEQGSLYPALYRLEDQGWIKSEWGVSENNRKAKFYSLTATGKKQLNAETANWERMAAAINLILGRA